MTEAGQRDLTFCHVLTHRGYLRRWYSSTNFVSRISYQEDQQHHKKMEGQTDQKLIAHGRDNEIP